MYFQQNGVDVEVLVEDGETDICLVTRRGEYDRPVEFSLFCGRFCHD